MVRKVPIVRFKGHFDAWEQRKLSELAEVKTGFPFKSKDFVINGDYLIITNGNIQTNSENVDGTVGNRITEVKDEVMKRYILDIGDILVTMDGNVGRTAKVVDKKQILAQRVGRLVSIKNSEFIYQLTITGQFFNEMTKVSHGGTIKHISLDEIGNYNTFVPRLDDEGFIVGSFLSTLDNTISLLQRKLDLLQELKKTMLNQLFPQTGSNYPTLRFSGFTDDWVQRKLGDFGSIGMNRRIFKSETTATGEIPFYKIGTFGSKPDAYITREKFEKYKRKYPYPDNGDVLISASGSIGKKVIYKGKEEYFQDSNIVWLNHKGSIDNKFLYYFYDLVKWEGLEGSTIKRLYNINILNTPIVVPSRVEQCNIGFLLLSVDQTITLHQRKLELLKLQKQYFLKVLFV